jgi:GNAT superfamily N-acetyltransferase
MDPQRPAVDVRALEPADVDAVAAVLARAFYDDPLQVWALPDDETRQGRLEAMFALQIRYASLPFGESYLDSSGSCVALWAPPPGLIEPDAESIAGLAPLADILGEGLGRLRLAFETMQTVHPRVPHFYLQGVGTDPPAQGHGLASAVLRPVLARCDAQRVPAYLESTKERNVGFYERHGWEVTDVVHVPSGGPPLWLMWREPR